MNIDRVRLDHAIDAARAELLGRRSAGPWWEGHLSSSAVSTATAVIALQSAGFDEDGSLVERATEWLVGTQNADGGWGDTPNSQSNIAATALTCAALTMAPGDHLTAFGGAGGWIESEAPGGDVATAIRRRYGDDRTFQAPILAACALAGLVEWEEVPPLPFELSVLPRGLHAMLRLQVVSYALPALIAVGALIHTRRRGNPAARILRSVSLGRALSLLPDLQPSSGGFLEAAPLTAFVAMSLVPLLGRDHVVVEGCLEFLREGVRGDGSWPIDSNLSVWVTTNALMALRQSGGIPGDIAEGAHEWLLKQQLAHTHPFTGAGPGGWPWTHLPGGVPDADDTAGAVIEMAGTGEGAAARAGVVWLSGLQNTDAGWPTFCQGWGRLPFDSSSPDITAHALRAIDATLKMDDDGGGYLARLLALNMGATMKRGFGYLAATQHEDGSWAPLWFGNQRVRGEANPVLGTARVLAAWADCGHGDDPHARQGLDYLLGAQNGGGGWGGGKGITSSVEETALAVSALSRFAGTEQVDEAISDGVDYLLAHVEDGSWVEPSPIGLYFASLWYTEDLYPITWTLEALGRVRKLVG